MNNQMFSISENDSMKFCFLDIKNIKDTGICFIILSKMIIASSIRNFNTLKFLVRLHFILQKK